jgi:alkanesulfonate monooxygenase SsuD/methylene tetrahydromethanopterin reductase-like flavin-dependent oxidoreductase (luciferase family)
MGRPYNRMGRPYNRMGRPYNRMGRPYSMKPIRFGFVIPGELQDPALRSTYVADVNRSLSMIAGHFESAWMVDHLQFDDADVLEGFTSIAYLSALHPALKFGNAVLCQSFRSPALLAKMGATLQLLSGGRFLLGLGACWNEAEHRAYGYDFPSSAVRVEQLEETLQIIQAMWTQDTVTFEGKHYQLRAALRAQTRSHPRHHAGRLQTQNAAPGSQVRQ